jgi:hypothetical protein
MKMNLANEIQTPTLEGHDFTIGCNALIGAN